MNRLFNRLLAVATASVALAAAPVSAPLAAQSTGAAQTKTPPAKEPAKEAAHHADHHQEKGAKKEGDHAASGWKELDAYHRFMMDTWHPANGKNDLAPIRAKATDMLASAKTLAASTGPKGCDTPAVKASLAKVVSGTQGVVDLVAKKADDATVKSALKALHDQFETVEECGAGHSMKH